MGEQEKLQLVDLSGFIQMGKTHVDHIHTSIKNTGCFFLISDFVQTSLNSILHMWFIHVTVSLVTEVPHDAKFPFTGQL